MKNHSLVIVFTLFDALVANKYLDLFGLNYRLEAPKAIRFQGTWDHLPVDTAPDVLTEPDLPAIPDLILLNDLEKLPATFLHFLEHYWDSISLVYLITHTGSKKALQTRNIQLLKDHLGDKLHPHPLSQHSSCGIIVEQFVELGLAYQTRDQPRYAEALQSIKAEFSFE